MIKTFLMKTLTVGLLVVGSSCIGVNAQQAASGRELKIVSFAEADKSDCHNAIQFFWEVI